MKQALQSAGIWEWGLIGLVVMALWLLPGAWLLRWRVAREVRARPAFGAALWTVVYALALWAMLAIVALIAMQAAGAGGGWPLLAVAFVLSCLALGTGVRMFLPGPDGTKLRWPRALWAAWPVALVLWAWGGWALIRLIRAILHGAT